MVRLIVFVDESGTTAETEENFTLASVWCAPTTKEGYQTVLRPTVDATRLFVKQLTGDEPKELHFAAGLKRNCDPIHERLTKCSYEDSTIFRKNLLWPGRPLAYRFLVSSPKIEAILPGYDKRLFHKNFRARGIISLLMPLLLYQDNPTIEVSVILDAEIWKESIVICEECLKNGLSNGHVAVSFSCENSSRVPGLQIADIAAGIVRHHSMDTRKIYAYDEIVNATIHRLEGQTIVKGVKPLQL